VRVLARTCASEAACPGCGVVSRRVHSHYQRRLADTASGGQEVLIHLEARRFFCGNDACLKATFAEQVPGLAVRYGRRTCERRRDQAPGASLVKTDAGRAEEPCPPGQVLVTRGPRSACGAAMRRRTRLGSPPPSVAGWRRALR
jgi:transposase IS204/IS1001/IS1096/IS1165 family protein